MQLDPTIPRKARGYLMVRVRAYISETCLPISLNRAEDHVYYVCALIYVTDT